MEELIKIQSELKAPKNQYNSHGGYKYRSCEDILEAVKPLCVKYNVLLTINDEIITMPSTEKTAIKDKNGNVIGYDECSIRAYMKATATITNGSGNQISISAFAREPFVRKGSDQSQITGAASSYARKYALNGLFLIDDTKDADATNNGETEKTEEKPKPKVKKKPALPDNKFADAVKFLKNGKTMDELKTYYTISKETEKKLNEAML